MKLIFSQLLNVMESNYPYTLKKEIESNSIPCIGMKITDCIWEEPYEYEIVDMILNYTEDECLIYLEQYKFPINNKEEFANMANLHGWTCSWQIQRKLS